MKLSIIITSWNTKKLLQSCLRSLQAHIPDVPFEIIVVDNASHDASAEMVEKEFPQVTLIKNSINSGYAGGNNIGFTISSGEYILLLGSDTEALPHTIETMIEILETRKDVGIVSCKLQLPNGSIQPSCQRFPTVGNAVAMYLSLHILNKNYHMHDFDFSTEQEVDQSDATCILIRRKALDNTILDERFSILYNDVDLCQRIKRKNWKIVYTPTTAVIHHGSQSTRQAPPHLRLIMYQNILLYYHTYFGLYARFILAPILVIRFLITTKNMIGFKLFFPTSDTRLP